jgi:hypothetical protein
MNTAYPQTTAGRQGTASQTASLGQAIAQSEINSVMDELNKELTCVEHEFEQLSAKIQPVVLPYPCAPSGTKDVPSPAMSPLGGTLASVRDRINTLGRNLSDLRNGVRL